jgi:hypothetical protein
MNRHHQPKEDLMTPIHERLIDALLQRLSRRVEELLLGSSHLQKAQIQLPEPQQLRSSPIGQHLIAIARYVEGYPYPGPEKQDVRASITAVSRAFYGDLFTTNAFRFPPKFHRTPLGKLINEALVRFYTEQRPGQLLTIGTMQERFQVKRQTIHQWIGESKIFPVYIDGTTRFYLPDVEQLQKRREIKQKSGKNKTHLV